MKEKKVTTPATVEVLGVTEVSSNLPVVSVDYTRLVEEWITFTKKHSGLKSAQSERSYRNAIKQALNYFSEHNVSILSATDDDVYQWLEFLKSQKSASTVQMYLVAVRLFFSFLTKQKIIAENPCDGMKAGVKIKRDEHKRDYLSAAQIRALLAQMPTDTEMGLRNRAVVALMVTSGLRCCEVSEAQCGDLRTSGDSTYLYLRGKGYTEKNNRVKVEPTAEKFIRDYWAVRFKGKTPKDKDFMFISTSRNHKKLDTDDELSTVSIRTIVKNALKAIGINDSRHTAHSLRHTACTLALKSGERLESVKMAMRHARVETTLIYSHLIEREKNNCELAIGKMIFGDKKKKIL